MLSAIPLKCIDANAIHFMQSATTVLRAQPMADVGTSRADEGLICSGQSGQCHDKALQGVRLLPQGVA